jgi:hypothetical protein
MICKKASRGTLLASLMVAGAILEAGTPIRITNNAKAKRTVFATQNTFLNGAYFELEFVDRVPGCGVRTG